MEHIDSELKQEFQLERIIFFSDAVFAIAITLLIIDIRIPFQTGMDNANLLQAVAGKIPELIGFITSFFFIGSYWVIHHKLFGYVVRFDVRLIWINLLFLFSVVLLPFTTSIFGMYGNLTAGFCIYIFNVVFVGIMNFFCWKHILNPAKPLTTHDYGKDFRHAAYIRSLLIPSWFFICGLTALFTNAFAGEMMLPFVGIIFAIYFKMSKRKSRVRKISPQANRATG